MKRLPLFLAAIAFVGCQRERTAPVAPATPPTPAVSESAPPPIPATPVLRSTPAQCAGDGSYLQAVDCFRIASSIHFKSPSLDGALTRRRIGDETLTIHVRDGRDRGEWIAEAKPRGIVWTKDGKAAKAVPQDFERLHQRLTLFPDVQKKEGEAQRTGSEDGAIHYEFTDANNGDRYVVWVSQTDGSMTRLEINGTALTFPR